MKKMLFITLCLFVSLVASFTTQAETYCTTKNWKTAGNYYKKYEKALNVSIDKLNVMVDEKNDFDFYYTQFSVYQVAELWAAKQEVISTALNTQHKIASERVEELTALRAEFSFVKKKFITAKQFWDKIGNSCEDDGEWDNGRQASKNWKNADKALTSSLNSIKKTERMRVAYRKDKKLIVAGYSQYKKTVDGSASEQKDK